MKTRVAPCLALLTTALLPSAALPAETVLQPAARFIGGAPVLYGHLQPGSLTFMTGGQAADPDAWPGSRRPWVAEMTPKGGVIACAGGTLP